MNTETQVHSDRLLKDVKTSFVVEACQFPCACGACLACLAPVSALATDIGEARLICAVTVGVSIDHLSSNCGPIGIAAASATGCQPSRLIVHHVR